MTQWTDGQTHTHAPARTRLGLFFFMHIRYVMYDRKPVYKLKTWPICIITLLLLLKSSDTSPPGNEIVEILLH